MRVREGALNYAINYAQKGCAMQMRGITLKKVFLLSKERIPRAFSDSNFNQKNYNFLACDWFKKALFSTNSLAKLLLDSFYWIYLLLTEFEVRTVSYGPSFFFPFDLCPSEVRGSAGAALNRRGKNEDP